MKMRPTIEAANSILMANGSKTKSEEKSAEKQKTQDENNQVNYDFENAHKIPYARNSLTCTDD